MAAKNATLRSQANGLPQTSSPIPEPELPGIHQLKHELSQMLETTMSDSCDALTLLNIAAIDEVNNPSSGPIFSSSSSVTAQNETNGENMPVGEQQYEEDKYEYEEDQYRERQYEEEAQCGEQRNQVEEFYYVSNEVQEYHSLLLKANDALSVDANACRQLCYHLLASKHVRKSFRLRHQRCNELTNKQHEQSDAEPYTSSPPSPTPPAAVKKQKDSLNKH